MSIYFMTHINYTMCESYNACDLYLIGCAFNEEGLSERALSEEFEFVIVFELLPLFDVLHLYFLNKF